MLELFMEILNFFAKISERLIQNTDNNLAWRMPAILISYINGNYL